LNCGLICVVVFFAWQKELGEIYPLRESKLKLKMSLLCKFVKGAWEVVKNIKVFVTPFMKNP